MRMRLSLRHGLTWSTTQRLRGLPTRLTLQAGIERNSPDFAAAMEGNFATLLNRAQAQANPAAQPTPAFFQPPEPARSPSPSPASIYSAPVSRQAAEHRLSGAVAALSKNDSERAADRGSKWNLRRSIRAK